MTNAPDIDFARVYDDARLTMGARLLVDRFWPRGIGKDDLELEGWIREVAPSTELRKWFGHDPDRWEEFRHRYRAELDDNKEAVERCLAWCRKGPVVLLYGARIRDRNQSVMLREIFARDGYARIQNDRTTAFNAAHPVVATSSAATCRSCWPAWVAYPVGNWQRLWPTRADMRRSAWCGNRPA